MICGCCGADGPTRHVVFHENIGFTILRVYRSLEGNVCRACAGRHFWRYSLVTLFFGWWGPISCLVTPYFLAHNVWQFVRCLTLEPPSSGFRPLRLTSRVIDRLLPHARRVIDGLNRGEDPERIARDVAARAAVAPGQVVLFMSGQVTRSAGAG